MFLSLRTRLVLAYFLFALLAVGIVTLGLGRAATLHLKDATGTHLQELAYEMSDRLDRGMFERHKDMQVLAQLDLMRDPTVGDDQRQLLVEELQRTFTPYAWIGYVTPDGEVRASTGSLLEGANVSSREWFRRARQSAFVGDVHDAVLLAKLLPHEGSEPLRFVDVSTPVRDRQGRLVAVLGAHLSWSWAREVQQGLLQPVHERRVDVLVLSRDHTVLLGPAELQGRKLALDVLSRPGLLAHEVERWPDGTSYVTGVSVSQGYRDYPGLGWTVVTREPAADAFAVVYGFQRAALVAAFLVALAFGVLGAWRAHAITLPLARLT
ncbi:cache domain-containing protein, partial [Deinococcus pimensis]|uniref:cache domain-containing protein n=1 Tax=Deinococcus pimensis TaxID=309888 RepID=UPI0004846F17